MTTYADAANLFFHITKLSAENWLVNGDVTTYTDRVTRHKANFATSQWAQPLDESMLGAACLGHRDLPWTADATPPRPTLHRMREVCHQCPVILKCADRALHGNSGRSAEGGMYAGVWLPWVSRSDNEAKRIDRRRAVQTLQHFIRRSKKPDQQHDDQDDQKHSTTDVHASIMSQSVRR